jgi:cytoskeletal protein CcmA (bactofilin family)
MFGKRDDQRSSNTPSTPPPQPASAPAATTGSYSTSSQQITTYQNNQPELNALLGKGSSFEGKLTFEGTVRIDGRFKGQILANDTLIIGDEGIVEGEITVGELICSGTVRGTIRTARSSEFLAPAKIEAELFTAQLRVEKGVIFDGNIHMKTRE